MGSPQISHVDFASFNSDIFRHHAEIWTQIWNVKNFKYGCSYMQTTTLANKLNCWREGALLFCKLYSSIPYPLPVGNSLHGEEISFCLWWIWTQNLLTKNLSKSNVNNYIIPQHQAISTSDMMYIEFKSVINETGISYLFTSQAVTHHHIDNFGCFKDLQVS